MTDQQFVEIMGQLALLKLRLLEIEKMVQAGRGTTVRLQPPTQLRLNRRRPNDIGDVSNGTRKIGAA
jgi:hypothetical protein